MKKGPISQKDILLKRTQEDLEDLVMYVEELTTFLPLAVCSVNPIGVITKVNKAFEDLTGYTSIEIVGGPVEPLFLEKDRLEKLLNEVTEKEIRGSGELTLLSKTGKKIPVSVSASIRKDINERFIGYFMGITDITELREFQEKLEEKVQERTKELQAKVEELERFHRLTVGRELKMMELKKSLDEAQKELQGSKEKAAEKNRI